jgi:Mn2+/Fe2+ NRAMP family transporter
VIRLVLLMVQLKPVHWVEASDVLRSLVLPMLVTVMVAVTTASAGHTPQHRQHKHQFE